MRARPHRVKRGSKTRYLVAAIVPALIVMLAITGFMSARKPVTLTVDGRSFEVATQATEVGDLLAERGVALGERDVVAPPLGSKVTAGDEVVVRRAVPVVLDLGGERIELEVVGERVADALVAAGAGSSNNIGVTPGLDAPLEPHMVISAPDVFVRVESEVKTLPAETVTREDDSLPVGRRVVVAEGEPGRQMRVYRRLVIDGVEGPRVLATEELVTPSTPQVVAVGTARRAPVTAATASPSGQPAPTREGGRMVVVATGYSAQQPGLSDFTATGAPARRGAIAVDPTVIPLGTRLYVPGYGYGVATDTGGAVKGAYIDLCFDTVGEALVWGRRTVTIIVLD